MQRPTPLRTDRIRTVEPPFGWIPFRILTSGLLAQLSLQAKLLYFFLCLVADEQGMSYYGERRLKEPGPQEPPVESVPPRRSGPPKQLGELLTALGWRS
jgi:hypothetical protein